MAEAAGRDPASLQPRDLRAPSPTPHSLAQLRDVGAALATLMLPALDRDAALAAMDSYAPLVEEFNGAAAG